jgi:hypothetical protein
MFGLSVITPRNNLISKLVQHASAGVPVQCWTNEHLYLKGLGHEIEFNFFTKMNRLVIKNLGWFFNFKVVSFTYNALQ